MQFAVHLTDHFRPTRRVPEVDASQAVLQAHDNSNPTKLAAGRCRDTKSDHGCISLSHDVGAIVETRARRPGFASVWRRLGHASGDGGRR